MSIHRETPTCPYCGKLIAKAIHKKFPEHMMLCGDTFLRWEYFDCDCTEFLECDNKRVARLGVDPNSLIKLEYNPKLDKYIK